MPKVSIIIIHYNRLGYLKQQLNEYLKWQNNNTYEFIVVSYCSDAESCKKSLKQYNEWCNLIFLPENKGPSYARNIGIKHALGKYIQFIDDDDLITQDKLIAQIKYLENHPLIDVIIGPFKKENWDSNSLPIIPKQLETNASKIKQINTCSDLIQSYSFFPAAAALFKKQVLEKVKGFDENRWYIEDVDLYLRLFAAGVRFEVNNKLTFGFFWRIHNHHKSLSNINKTGFMEGCLLNYFFCIDHNIIVTEQDHLEVYSGIFHLLKQADIKKSPVYQIALSKLNKLNTFQRMKYLPKYYSVANILGSDNLFKIIHLYYKAKKRIKKLVFFRSTLQ